MSAIDTGLVEKEVGRAPGSLPVIEDVYDLIQDNTIQTPPELINGMFHQGSKMVLGGGSKTNKTWVFMDLAISVAAGASWWGRKTTQGRVLYLNFELRRFSFQKRIRAIESAKKIKLAKGRLDHWCLRGYARDICELSQAVIKRARDAKYNLIILDPIYKCFGGRKENAAEDVAIVMNELGRIEEATGASIAFGAHFSKGNQAGKESIDRISGSGVFARDPDTILTLTPHSDAGGNSFAVDTTLRDLPPVAPFCVTWTYPLMLPNDSLNPADLRDRKNGKHKRELTEADYIAQLPIKWKAHPKEALRNQSEMEQSLSGFNKAEVKAFRDRLERMGSIGVITGLPHNRILIGRPEVVTAYRAAEVATNGGSKL